MMNTVDKLTELLYKSNNEIADLKNDLYNKRTCPVFKESKAITDELVKDCIKNNESNVVDAIKELREVSNCGLRVAHTLIKFYINREIS